VTCSNCYGEVIWEGPIDAMRRRCKTCGCLDGSVVEDYIDYNEEEGYATHNED